MRLGCLAALAFAACLASPSLASAKELNGVTAPETASAGGKELKLNGMGLRKKAFFKVYVAALYLESKSKDAAAILAADSVRRVEMTMLRDLGREKVVEAINDGIQKNAPEALPKLKERLGKFTSAIPDLKEGEKLTLMYVPGTGTSVTGGSGQAMTVEGKDFADALFSVWLGKEPVSESLRDGMLGVE
jgi:Chalcone isomerase-like